MGYRAGKDLAIVQATVQAALLLAMCTPPHPTVLEAPISRKRCHIDFVVFSSGRKCSPLECWRMYLPNVAEDCMSLKINTYMLGGPGRDEMSDHRTPSDHVAESAPHELSPVRKTKS